MLLLLKLWYNLHISSNKKFAILHYFLSKGNMEGLENV